MFPLTIKELAAKKKSPQMEWMHTARQGVPNWDMRCVVWYYSRVPTIDMPQAKHLQVFGNAEAL